MVMPLHLPRPGVQDDTVHRLQHYAAKPNGRTSLKTEQRCLKEKGLTHDGVLALVHARRM